MLTITDFQDQQLPGTIELDIFRQLVAKANTPTNLRTILEEHTLGVLATCAHLSVLERAAAHARADTLVDFETSLKRQLLLQAAVQPSTLSVMSLASRSAELAAKAKVLSLMAKGGVL
jgi:hypothetical protein